MLLEASPTKVARMLLADGPRRTGVKVRNKLAQRRYLGGYRATLVFGHSHEGGAAVLALAPQAPASADWFLVPQELVVTVGDATRRTHLLAAAGRLQRSVPALRDLPNERFLSPGNRPPRPVVEALRRAAAPTSPPAVLRAGRPRNPAPPTLVRV